MNKMIINQILQGTQNQEENNPLSRDNNRTKFRNDSDCIVTREVKITMINILKVEKMGNM